MMIYYLIKNGNSFILSKGVIFIYDAKGNFIGNITSVLSQSGTYAVTSDNTLIAGLFGTIVPFNISYFNIHPTSSLIYIPSTTAPLLTTTLIIVIACIAFLIFGGGIAIYLYHLSGFTRCANRAKKLFCQENEKGKRKKGDAEKELDQLPNIN